MCISSRETLDKLLFIFKSKVTSKQMTVLKEIKKIPWAKIMRLIWKYPFLGSTSCQTHGLSQSSAVKYSNFNLECARDHMTHVIPTSVRSSRSDLTSRVVYE